MKGKIFDIQRFCMHDGPGIRTTVFLKGCPLRCLWCHNPESWKGGTEIAFDTEKCVACGACAELCESHRLHADGTHEFDREQCRRCGRCAEVCLYDAVTVMGREVDADEVISAVMKDERFYANSGGGVTFSGGEPLSQPAFLTELLKKAKEKKLHTCVDTSGYANGEDLKRIAPYVDLFLFDYKESDDTLHQRYTGVSNVPIRENLLMLDALGAKTVLRCPIIPGLNDREDHFAGIAALVCRLEHLQEVNVMAYHPLGNGKYTALGKENPLPDRPSMDAEYKQVCIKRILTELQRQGKKTVTVK